MPGDITEEKAWRNVFRSHGYQVYDHVYPFRLAAKMVLRQDARNRRQPSDFSQMDHETLALKLNAWTTHFMGVNFVFEYFIDWFKHLPVHQQGKVVICGLGQDPSSTAALRPLRSMGAVVVSRPPLPGDIHAHSTRSLEDVIRSFQRPTNYAR